jgi:hypothetical protein
MNHLSGVDRLANRFSIMERLHGVREGRGRGITPTVGVYGHATGHRSLDRCGKAKHINHDADPFRKRRGDQRTPLEANAVPPLPGPSRYAAAL